MIPRLNYTCPSNEDIAVTVSFIVDPSTGDTALKIFCITVHTNEGLPLPRLSTGPGKQLIATLANLIRQINSLQTDPKYKRLTSQFYVWSSTDRIILQTNIIHGALSSETNADDIRVCIGALAQGATLLQTAYQPLLLSGALLGFLSKKQRLKKEYQACLARMDLPTTGTLEECRKRVEAAIIRLNEARDNSSRTGQKQRELGQVPRVVVLKREVERLIALPVPGCWDLPECFQVLHPQAAIGGCPSEEELYGAYRHGTPAELQTLLERRNYAIYAVLSRMRLSTRIPNCPPLLVNEAKVLSIDFMDLCRNDTLRKLFYMQQVRLSQLLKRLYSIVVPLV